MPDAEAVAPSLDAVSPPSTAAVRLDASARGVEGLGTDPAATIAWAVAVAPEIPPPAHGATAIRWEMLAAAASVDVGAARVLEPHADALAILAEARGDGIEVDLAALDVDAASSWGVYAAEGPGVRLTATRTPEGWRLDGTKPWCSLAAHVSHALVTAWTGESTRGLFAVALRQRGVTPHGGPWSARGLAAIVSAPVDFDAVPAAPVGEGEWYLRRDGFAWGGAGVAAVWWGSAVPLARRLADRARAAGADQVAAVAAGRADAACWTMRAVLAEAAALVDRGHPSPARLAEIVRAVVRREADAVRDDAVRALGPGPLTTDEPYARRVADLELYLAQHHGDRDLARLGRQGSS